MDQVGVSACGSEAQAAAFPGSHSRDAAPARAANRAAPRSYHVTPGVSLRPKHPAFYALSLRMAAKGYVLRKSAKGDSATFTVRLTVL